VKLPHLQQHEDSTLNLCTGAYLRLCELHWKPYGDKQMVP